MRFAQIGYGSDGRGDGKVHEGYTYLVSDTVRPEQVMQVIAHSHGTQTPPRAFPTTGKVLKVTSAQPSGAPADATRAYTQKELGVKSGFGKSAELRQAEARYNALAVYNKENLGGLTGKAAEEKLAITGDTKTERLMSEGYETYADYVKRTGGFGGSER